MPDPSASPPARPDAEDPPRVLLVLTNLPDHDTATKLAAALVEARLAACANVLAPCTSVYRWQGEVETASEVPVLMKTTARALPCARGCDPRPPPLRTSRDRRGPCGAGLARLSRLGRARGRHGCL